MAHALSAFLITTKYIRCKLLLLKPKEEGRQRADAWLEQNAGLLGRRSSIDLNAFV